MTQKQAVLTLYAVSACFGSVAVVAGSRTKLVALALLIMLMAMAVAVLVARGKARSAGVPAGRVSR